MVFFKNSYKTATNNRERRIIKEMDEKLTFIMDITEEYYPNKFIFYDFMKFLDFFDLVKVFYEDWDRYKELSEFEEKKKIEHIVSQLDRLILENNKHYGKTNR